MTSANIIGIRTRRAISALLVILFLACTFAWLGALSILISEPTLSSLITNPPFWGMYIAIAYGAFRMTATSWFGARGRVAGVVGILVVFLIMFLTQSALHKAAADFGQQAETRLRVADEHLTRAMAELQPLLSALAAFDPDTKVMSSQAIVASVKSGQFDVQRDGGQIIAAFGEALPKALTRTTEGALQGYLEAHTQMLDEISRVSAEDCVMAITGSGDPAFGARIARSVAPGTQPALRAASVRVLMEAAGRPPATPATARQVDTYLKSMKAPLKKSSIDIEWLSGGASARQQCDAYRAVFRLIPKQAEPARSRLARLFLAGQ